MTPLFDTLRLHKPLVGVEIVETSTPEQLENSGRNVQVSSIRDTVSMLPHEIEQVRAEAYAAGVSDATQQIESRINQEQEAHRNSVERALDSMLQLKRELIAEVEGLVPELLVEGAGRLLAGWVPTRESVEAIVEELLSDFDNDGHVMRIHLNPTTLETLTEAGAENYARQNPGLEFVADPGLQAGESKLEGRFGLADARYSAKLKNLREVLTHE